VVEQFMTDTALEADIVLPAKNMFEQSDIIGSYWNPYVQYKPRVMEPEGQSLPETEIYRKLMEQLGMKKDEINDIIPFNNINDVEEYLKSRVKEYPELNWNELEKGPVLPPGHEEVTYKELYFNTPSGKIELWSDRAKTDWGIDELPDFIPLIEGKDEDKEKYPFHLMTPNTKNRIHSQFGNLEMIKAVAGEPGVQISFADAERMNILEGDLVRIFNDRGEITLPAQPDAAIRPGCVAVFNGLWIEEGGTPNFLSKGRETDIGHGTAFHDNLVQIEKI
jgi:anaerobic selenocysteine-containing dehydrogenase